MKNNTNFKLALLLIVFLLPLKLLAQNIKKDSYFELTGTLNKKDGTEISLKRDYFGDNILVAKDTIRHQQFHFRVPVEQITIIYLVTQENRMIDTHTVILEPGKIKFSLGESDVPVIEGGKYNPLLFAYERDPEFINADKLMKAEGQAPPVPGDTLKQYRLVQHFLKKDSIRTTSQLKIMYGNDAVSAVMAAILLELQPDRQKAMALVNKDALKLGEKSFIIQQARRLNKSQENLISMRLGNMVGQGMYDFSAQTTGKDSIRLSKIVLTHKYTLLQFWASWCVPCREEIPGLKKIYAEYKKKGLEIISFSLDNDHPSWFKASEQEQIRWPNVSDMKAMGSPVVKNYSISSIPANVIIDQQGKVVAANLVGPALAEEMKTLFQ